MIKPTMPNMPGMEAMNDSLEFVQKLWSGMNVPGVGMPGMPGMVMPTLSVEEINKQIADLRAVEAWLNLNMNMLRGTIQALEVQSATLATLQSMGEAFQSAANQAANTNPFGAATATPESTQAPGAQAGSTSASKPESEPPSGANTAGAQSANPFTASSGQSGVPPVNPAMWWNMLQDQFKQAVDSAMTQQASQPATKEPAAKASSKNTGTKRKPDPKSPE